MLRSRITVFSDVLLAALLLTSVTADARMSKSFASDPDDGPCSSLPASPHFSIKPGDYSSPLSVSLTDHTRGAIIYYTTDAGWTPTSNSTRYLRSLSRSTKPLPLKLLLLFPTAPSASLRRRRMCCPPKLNKPPVIEALPVRSGVQGALALRADARIPLVFASPVDSRTAHVGDAITLTLAEDLMIGDTVFRFERDACHWESDSGGSFGCWRSAGGDPIPG